MTAKIVAGNILSTSTMVQPAAATKFAMDPMIGQSQNIKVAVRLRPLNDQETNKDSTTTKANGATSNSATANSTTTAATAKQDGATNDTMKNAKKGKVTEKRAWNLTRGGATDTLTQKGAVRKVPGRNIFHFDQIFDEDTKTPLLYKSIARPMVKSVLSGRHCTIFAYGQTGSGKTFTMQGDGKAASGQAGIIQLVASDLFRFMKQGVATQREYTVKVSYVEIYNEKIRDLLSEDGCGSTASHGSKEDTNNATTMDPNIKEITIRTTASGEVFLNCQQTEVTTVDNVLDLLISGNANRVVAKTDVNQHSSRSHAIFRLTVESRAKDDDPVNKQGNEMVRIADFNLVDLAGSESVKISNTSGLRQREGAKINQSLLSLSTVIHNLSLPAKKKPRHINYRDSKLTRILQPHLSGNAEMAILCCASPAQQFVEETRSTLKFAARAKLVQMEPQVNEVLDDGALIRALRKELAALKKELEEYRKGGPPGKHNEGPKVADKRRMSLEAKGPQRAYVMPKNLPMPQDQKDKTMMEEFLKDQSEQVRSALDQSAAQFQLDAVDEEAARKTVFRYMQGRDSDDENPASVASSQEEISEISHLNSFDFPLPGKNSFDLSTPSRLLSQPLDGRYPDKRYEGARTERTEDETFDIPEASYAEVSMKFGSVVSTPESLRVNSIQGERSKPGTLGSGDYVLGGDIRNTLSWDTMDLNTLKTGKNGKPLESLQSLTARNAQIPLEITIISDPSLEGLDKMCLTDQLDEAEARSKFFQDKLERSDDLIETLFKDLERARLCIHDLVFRNVNLQAKLKKKLREDIKEEYQEGEQVVELYWCLKGAMYVSLFFFITGGFEFFLASVFLIWLILEANLGT